MNARAQRDILIFLAVMVGGGWLGVGLNAVSGAEDPMNGLGTLVWLLAPVLAALVLAVLAGGWWRRLGLGFGSAGSGKYYALALVATPVAMALVFLLGSLSGAVVFTLPGDGAWLGLAGTLLVSSAIKNVFEEVCWRGFLTPWFERAGFAGLVNHLLTGLIWALWHLPYWLFFLTAAQIMDYSGLPVWGMIVLAFAALPLQAVLYGELRLATGSIWPAWVLHTVTNVLSQLLLLGGLVSVNGLMGAVLLSPGTSGVLYSVLIGGAGYWLFRARTRRMALDGLGGAA